jgi:hypothetical protein
MRRVKLSWNGSGRNIPQKGNTDDRPSTISSRLPADGEIGRSGDRGPEGSPAHPVTLSPRQGLG